MTAEQSQLPAVRSPKAQVVAGGQVAALVPQSLDEAFRVANAIAASGLAPKGVDKPEQVLVAIMAGAELGFAPFQAMQSFAVINGKPNIWGDALPALLWSHGFDIDEWFDNEDAPTKAFCKITRPNGKVIERTFSVADAKRAGLAGKQGPWQQYQKRMLQMRARAFAARDGASDVLRGMPVAEEVQDYQHVRDVTGPAPGTGMRARLEARDAEPAQGFDADHIARQTGVVDAQTGEVQEPTTADLVDGDDIPAEFTGAVEDADHDQVDEFPGDKAAPQNLADDLGLKTGAQLQAEKESAFDPIQWAADFNTDLESMDFQEIERALADPDLNARFEALKAKSPGTADALNKAIVDRKAALKKAAKQ